MGGFRLEDDQYNLTFEDPKFHGLEVQLTGMTMQEALNFDLARWAAWEGVERNAARVRAVAEIIVAHLVGWNLTEKDGSPTPQTADGLMSHPPKTQRAITDAYSNAVRGVSSPLDDASTTGEEVESLPTETLPPSP